MAVLTYFSKKEFIIILKCVFTLHELGVCLSCVIQKELHIKHEKQTQSFTRVSQYLSRDVCTQRVKNLVIFSLFLSVIIVLGVVNE